MIQRIQSVYLLLAGVLSAVAFFTPLANFTRETALCVMYATSFSVYGDPSAFGQVPSLPWGVMVFSLLSVLLPLYCIFKYRNRRSQMRLCLLTEIAYLVYYAAYIAYGVAIARDNNANLTPTLFAILPLIAFIAVILARKAIKSDEEKVRAADRIR